MFFSVQGLPHPEGPGHTLENVDNFLEGFDVLWDFEELGLLLKVEWSLLRSSLSLWDGQPLHPV